MEEKYICLICEKVSNRQELCCNQLMASATHICETCGVMSPIPDHHCTSPMVKLVA